MMTGKLAFVQKKSYKVAIRIAIYCMLESKWSKNASKLFFHEVRGKKNICFPRGRRTPLEKQKPVSLLLSWAAGKSDLRVTTVLRLFLFGI